jgi:hypothetical protein
VVLFGDSHALQYFPALQDIARRRGWRLVHLAKAACPPSRVRVVSTILRREYPECDRWREHALQRIDRERPAMVVTTGSARYTVVTGGERLDRRASQAALAVGYEPTLERLGAAAAEVIVLRDTPRPPIYVPDCVADAMDDLRRCAFARSAALDVPDPITVAARGVPGTRVIDPTGQFCAGTLCPAVIGDVLVYRNSGHVTATYTATMAPWLGRRLPPLGQS